MNIYFDKCLYRGKIAFERISELQNDIINSDEKTVELTIGIRTQTGLTFAFLIGCLIFLGLSKEKILRIKPNKKIYALLKRINVPDFFNQQNVQDMLEDKQLPCFRLIKRENDIFKLITEIGSEAPVEMSAELKIILTSRIGEMFLNAMEHSNAKYIVGGKYFKQDNNKYCFAAYDTGVGIPTKVRDYFKGKVQYPIADISALKWAMKRGSSTVNNAEVPRGVGLDLLKSFARLNDGAIRICSGKALYIYNSKSENYYQLENEFHGTLFEMDIIADNDHKYILS